MPRLQNPYTFPSQLLFGLGGEEVRVASLIIAISLGEAISQVGGASLAVEFGAAVKVASLRAVGATARVFSFPFVIFTGNPHCIEYFLLHLSWLSNSQRRRKLIQRIN